MKSTFLQIALIVSGGFVAAQTAIVPLSAVCPAGQITVATQTSTLHSPAGDSAIVKLTCATVDSGIVIDKTVTPWTLTPPPGQACPIQQIQMFYGSNLLNAQAESPAATSPTTFTLEHVPLGASLLLFFDGRNLTPGLEYTLSTNIITLANPLPASTGTGLRAYYSFASAL